MRSTLAAVAVPVAIGIRPLIGPRSRALTTRCFEPTPARLERGRYLATSVAGCFSCHRETDWQAQGFPVKAGTEGGGMWRAYGQTTEDLRVIFAFLQTVPPLAHRVDNTLPPTRCPVCGGLHGAGDQNVVPAGN
jgi:hypothetical protein